MAKNQHCQSPAHPSYKDQLTRLSKIGGQLEGVKSMIEDEKYCIDILSQLKAVRSAVHSLEATILKTHLDSCVKNLLESGQPATKQIDELLDLFKRCDSAIDCISCLCEDCNCINCKCGKGSVCEKCKCENCRCCGK